MFSIMVIHPTGVSGEERENRVGTILEKIITKNLKNWRKIKCWGSGYAISSK